MKKEKKCSRNDRSFDDFSYIDVFNYPKKNLLALKEKRKKKERNRSRIAADFSLPPPFFFLFLLIHKFLLPRMLKGWTSPRADYTRPFEECRAALPRIPRPGHGWLTKGIFSIIPRNVSLSTPSSDGIRLKRVSRSKSIKGYYSPPPSWRSLKDRCTFSTRRHLSLPLSLSLSIYPWTCIQSARERTWKDVGIRT